MKMSSPHILTTLPAKYPQEQFSLPARRRYRFVVESRRPPCRLIAGDQPPWMVAAVYPVRRYAIVHRRLILANHGHAGFEARIRREVYPW